MKTTTTTTDRKGETMRDTFERFHELESDYRRRLESCNHERRDFTTSFGNGERIRYCAVCQQDAQPAREAMLAEHRAARKRWNAAARRCDADGCNRRATYRFPYDVHVCGLHRRNMLRGFNRAVAGMGGLAIVIPAYSSAADLIEWANGA